MSASIRILILFFLLVACSQSESRAAKERKNLKTTLAFVDEIWNRKDLKNIDHFFSDELTRNENHIEAATNLVELLAIFHIYFTAFPDLQFTLEQITPVDNQVFMNWNITGTNTGVFGDVTATDKKVQINGITRLDFDEQGKINHQSIFYTELALLQQLGYVLDKPKIE
mgnify:CR=1 FL=1